MLLTVKDLAKYFKRTPRTIYRWRREGILPPPDRVLAGSPYWDGETVAEIGIPRRKTSVDEKDSGERSMP